MYICTYQCIKYECKNMYICMKITQNMYVDH